ncbi:stromelysin-3-like [Cochliomyia hominivorax]
MKIKLFFLIIPIFIYNLTKGFPVGPRDGIEIPPPEVIKFMRRFGYLDQNPDDSEALYHESAIVEAIKNIQKYGALNQTGKLDAMTLDLFTKPRCGVPDIEGKPYYLHQQPVKAKTVDLKIKRRKRFIFGAKTWTKRNIKYLIGNWSLKIPREQVERDIARALHVWSQYSNLKFHRVEDTSADIIVGFGSHYHGDNYPFDGAGNILAHAFYPYEMGSWGGDVHFDEDENWKENATDLTRGVDFYTVALHELGHSLGLAHSPVYSSIMFPYYKGPEHNVLDYDDTLAMYNAYLSKKLDDDVEVVNEDYESSETNTENEETTEEVNTTPYNWETTKRQKFPELTTTSSDLNKEKSYHSPIPNICEGHFNAVCYFNNSMHIFKGEYVWKLSPNYKVVLGYPKQLHSVFTDLPESVQSIDACYERYDKTLVVFIGNQIWYFKDGNLSENSPQTLTDLLGDTEGRQKVNAVLLWPKNNRTYIFADTIFWRYNDELQTMDLGYPKTMQRWPGIPNNIDAAATLPNGKTYFFKDNRYWLYDNLHVQPIRGYPRRASTAWLGCTTRTTQIPFRSYNTTVSFIYASSSFSPAAPSISAALRQVSPLSLRRSLTETQTPMAP